MSLVISSSGPDRCMNCGDFSLSTVSVLDAQFTMRLTQCPSCALASAKTLETRAKFAAGLNRKPPQEEGWFSRWFRR